MALVYNLTLHNLTALRQRNRRLGLRQTGDDGLGSELATHLTVTQSYKARKQVSLPHLATRPCQETDTAADAPAHHVSGDANLCLETQTPDPEAPSSKARRRPYRQRRRRTARLLRRGTTNATGAARPEWAQSSVRRPSEPVSHMAPHGHHVQGPESSRPGRPLVHGKLVSKDLPREPPLKRHSLIGR